MCPRVVPHRSEVATHSPRAASRPSSGCVESDACRGSRGASAVPASPSAGLSPIRRRPSRPSPDRACTTGRRRGIAHSYIFSFGNSPTRARARAERRSARALRRAGRPRSLSPQWLPGGFHAAVRRTCGRPLEQENPMLAGDSRSGRYWARTSDLLLVRQPGHVHRREHEGTPVPRTACKHPRSTHPRENARPLPRTPGVSAMCPPGHMLARVRGVRQSPHVLTPPYASAVPRTTPHLCSMPYCTNIVDGPGRCPEHSTNGWQTATVELGVYGHAWRKIRDACIAQHPMCERCTSAPVRTGPPPRPQPA